MATFRIPPITMHEHHSYFKKICIACETHSFQEAMNLAQELTAENNIVIMHFFVPFDAYTDRIYQMQLERIDICEALYLIDYKQDQNEFIDKQVRYAMWQGKRIFYHLTKMSFCI